MPDIAITWPALLAVLGAVATVGGAVAKLYGAMRAEFEKSRVESENRTIRTHERLDRLREDIAATYVPRELHGADLARAHDAISALGRQISEVSSRIDCPRRAA